MASYAASKDDNLFINKGLAQKMLSADVCQDLTIPIVLKIVEALHGLTARDQEKKDAAISFFYKQKPVYVFVVLRIMRSHPKVDNFFKFYYFKKSSLIYYLY